MFRKIIDVYVANKIRPSILPCGTPEETGRKFEFALFMLTHWQWLAR